MDYSTDTVIAGGGPAGLMTGLLLARAGVDVIVLEKHEDFLRDFRGDTIHPATQHLLDRIGLAEEFLARDHADTERITLSWYGQELPLADFTHLPTSRATMTFMPQWDFLDLLASAAAELRTFRLLRSTQVDGLLYTGRRVSGVRATGPEGPVQIRARLVIGADGRDSTVRDLAGITPIGRAAAMDVLWFRLPHDAAGDYASIQAGAGLIITLDRGTFLQVAHVIPAGGWAGTDADLARLQRRISTISPRMGRAVQQLQVEDVHLLRVRLERLRRWHSDGLLFIGDAAHAMSPAGGVGVNLAIQDAVAAARILAPVLRSRVPRPGELRRVQRRRSLPTRLTQRVQRMMQPALLSSRDRQAPMPWTLRLLRNHPRLARLTGRVVGLGFRPEYEAPAPMR
ncbi:MAG TPA: FAD-dependent oxidoreductase [Candidatus Ruania gallistercoris]|uniref:FAD-dependent oxidoreductase n=1 Tax=Candidatus Ruania gallistercoris TaxID=2838746 RepID=A0A9D2EBR8_9MICO|nr:FAD-dependent oxidoreductase [Candidatus Ruania gallistercoris]